MNDLINANLLNVIPTKILVTGGCGFMASNLILYLFKKYQNNIEIINIDRLDYCSNIDFMDVEVSACPKNHYTFVHGDITDFPFMHEFFDKNNDFDIIIHMAAQTHVDNSFNTPMRFTHDNVIGTHNMLDLAKNKCTKLKKFIHISTDEVYGEVSLTHDGCTEETLHNPTNPYSASKAAAEMFVKSYYSSFKLPIVIVRSNNVFGPRQYHEKIIPKFIKFLLEGKKCTIHGDGESRRNFIFTEDFCSAMDIVMLKGKINEVYNIADQNEFSVLDIVRCLVKKLSPHLKNKSEGNIDEYIEYVEDRKFNDYRYAINCDKLHALGWKPTHKFDQAMDITIDYYVNKFVTKIPTKN